MNQPATIKDCDIVVLAGGLGTRLRSVLPDRQKVLAPVGGAPFIFHLFRLLAACGADRAILALGHRADDALDCLTAWQEQFGICFEASVEDRPLGTGGAVLQALASCRKRRLLVMNGDSWVGIDLEQMLARHIATGATATVATVHVDDVGRYGSLDWSDESGHITGFREKDVATAGRSGWINAGIYLIERDRLEIIPGLPAGETLSLERNILPPLAGNGLFAYPTTGPFIDIGLPETYGRSEAFFAPFTPRQPPEQP